MYSVFFDLEQGITIRMSEGEERESLSREIDPAIWAIAPRLNQEEGPIDVTASPAFQCLDEVLHKNLYRRLLFSQFIV